MSWRPGDNAPDFALPADGSGTVSLGTLKGRTVILCFYPKNDAPGCTTEACGFRDALPDFTGSGAAVVGISRDRVASHDRFKAKHGLPFALASDADGKVCEACGTWVEKSMSGRKHMGVDRSTFLIDGKGVIRKAWRKVRAPGHVGKVLAAAKTV